MKKILSLSLILCLLFLTSCTFVPTQQGDEVGKDTTLATKQPESEIIQTDPVDTDDGQPTDSDQPTDTESTEQQTTFGPLHFPETEDQ